jgi:hypothetical protein
MPWIGLVANDATAGVDQHSVTPFARLFSPLIFYIMAIFPRQLFLSAEIAGFFNPGDEQGAPDPGRCSQQSIPIVPRPDDQKDARSHRRVNQNQAPLSSQEIGGNGNEKSAGENAEGDGSGQLC